MNPIEQVWVEMRKRGVKIGFLYLKDETEEDNIIVLFFDLIFLAFLKRLINFEYFKILYLPKYGSVK